jgi:hypothetical protein
MPAQHHNVFLTGGTGYIGSRQGLSLEHLVGPKVGFLRMKYGKKCHSCFLTHKNLQRSANISHYPRLTAAGVRHKLLLPTTNFPKGPHINFKELHQ